jgi:Uma2 family endonuclease
MAVTEQPPATRRFTADEVWRMVEVGILDEDEPYELLDGELLYVSPQGEPHAKAIGRLNMILAAEYGPRGYVVRVQSPVGGIVDSIPEPDLAVVSENVAEHPDRPRPEQTLLLVEVGITSLPRDRRKGEIYAASGAREYWIVDIPRDLVIVHTGHAPDGGWAQVREVGLDGAVELPGTGREIPVVSILRPARR